MTYANVMATVAVFIALGGSSYAALRVGSADIVDSSVRGRDIRDRTITHRDVGRNRLGGSNIAESRLGRVGRARLADGLTTNGAAALKVRCPAGTLAAAGLCFETATKATRALPRSLGGLRHREQGEPASANPGGAVGVLRVDRRDPGARRRAHR